MFFFPLFLFSFFCDNLSFSFLLFGEARVLLQSTRNSLNSFFFFGKSSDCLEKGGGVFFFFFFFLAFLCGLARKSKWSNDGKEM